MQTPDGITPVIGYRSWFTSKEIPLLGSRVNYGRAAWYYGRAAWAEPGEQVADCRFRGKEQTYGVGSRNHPAEEEVPGEECQCGFYSLEKFEMGNSYLFTNYELNLSMAPQIIGSVVSYGKVVPGDKGYRAQKMQIAALYVPPYVMRGKDRWKKEKQVYEHMVDLAFTYQVELQETVDGLRRAAERKAEEIGGVRIEELEAMWEAG